MTGIREIWFYANNIIRIARQLINDELHSMNLSSAEGNILLHLLTRERLMRQEDIVEELEISKPAVSRAVETLEQKGFIRRDKDPFDKRVNWVALTDKAYEIGPRIEQIYSQIFETAAEGLSEAEVQAFIQLFGRVSASFTQAKLKRKHRDSPDEQANG
jgi:DNA-binding MarR family transcriptional regulator